MCGEYGRYDFMLTNRRDKQVYCQAQLLAQCECELNAEGKEAEKLFREAYSKWNLRSILGTIDKEIFTGYIDHESVWVLPVGGVYEAKGPNGINIEFFKELCESIVENPCTVVFGGADGESPCRKRMEKLHEAAFNMSFLFYSVNGYTARKDNGVWILSQTDGGVTVVDLKEGEKMPALDVPYLVDVQVTEKCFQQCPYCYRCCSASGKEVKDSSELHHVIRNLFNMGVTNVVLGGGDVTECYAVLYLPVNEYLTCADANTLSTTVHMESFMKLHKEMRLLKFLSTFNGIGISIPQDVNKQDLRKLLDLIRDIEESKLKLPRMVFQIIPEMWDAKKLREFLDEVPHVSVNYLGWKDAPRMNASPKRLSKEALDVIILDMLKSYMSRMCDAVFAEKYGSELIAAGVKPEYLAKQEGLGSCFLDLVGKKLGLSSYKDVSVPFEWDVDVKDFSKNFIKARQEVLKKGGLK